MNTIFDGLDGKHARRLKLSSALGHLLDHSCDSFLALNFLSLLSILFNIEDSYFMYLLYASVSWTFFNSVIWDFFIGESITGVGYVGISEALFLFQFLHVIRGYFGVNFNFPIYFTIGDLLQSLGIAIDNDEYIYSFINPKLRICNILMVLLNMFAIVG